MDVLYPFWHHTRSRRAVEAARAPAVASDFEVFRGRPHALVVTYKRSGDPVATPVNVGLSDDGKLYFRSEPHVAKVKRIRNDARVRVAPCSIRGAPKGPPIEGLAHVLPESESQRGYAALSSSWRRDIAVVERAFDRAGVPAVYVEIEPVAPRSGDAGDRAS